jgi:hypothetical protein
MTVKFKQLHNTQTEPRVMPKWTHVHKMSGQGSVVCIATAYGLDGQGIEFRWGRNFPHLPRPTLEPIQTPVQ